MRLAVAIPPALLLVAAGSLCLSCSALGDAATEAHGRGETDPELLAAAAQATAERRAEVAELVDGLRADATALSALLSEMPKGADLHNHLSGAVPTRQLVAWGQQAGLCLQPSDFTLVKEDPCPDGTVALATLSEDAPLYGELLAAWSMAGQSLEPLDDTGRRQALADRHAHFFDAFLKFWPVTRDSTAKMIADVRAASARQHIGAVELMVSFGTSAAGRTAVSVFGHDPDWSGVWDDSTPLSDWTAKQAEIRSRLSKRFAPQVDELERWESAAREELRCDADDGTRDPGCDVDVRYLVQLNRTQTREHVFGQLIYGIELARSDDEGSDRIVGVNLALAEENETSLQSCEDDMFSIGVLRQIAQAEHPDAPPPRIALHAGELVPELLAEDGSDDRHLTFHIRDAAPVADRIGHGADIEREDPDGTLRAQMAERGVLVEACLTSNDWLLDMRGEAHPLRAYLDAGVPVALATDDGGVFGITLTDELVRAVQLHGLGYEELVQMARASIEHGFAPGASLQDDTSCLQALTLEKLEPEDLEELAPTCAELVRHSARARIRWTFERDLVAFELARVAPTDDGEP